MAIAYHNMRRVEEAVTYFKQLGEVDPYRLDNLDTYRYGLLYLFISEVQFNVNFERSQCSFWKP